MRFCVGIMRSQLVRKQQEMSTAMSFFASEAETRMPFQTRPTVPSKGISRMIEKHRYWRKAASDSSAKNRGRISFSRIGYFIARQLERFAMRRLVRSEPATCEEAKDKVLYLMAAVIAGPTQLWETETAELKKSVEPFKGELATFLRQR